MAGNLEAILPQGDDPYGADMTAQYGMGMDASSLGMADVGSDPSNLSPLASQLMTEAKGMTPDRPEVLQKRQALEEAMKRLQAAQAYRAPAMPPLQSFYSALGQGYGTGEGIPFFKGMDAYSGALDTQRKEHQAADIAQAETGTKTSLLGPTFDKEDIAQALERQKLGVTSQGQEAMLARLGLMGMQPEKVYDRTMNNGQGGFRFANKFEVNSNKDLQPADTVPDIEKSVDSPFGIPITKQSIANDQQRIKDVEEGTKNLNPAELENSYKTLQAVLKRNPQIGPGTPTSPLLNMIDPAMLGGISADDAKTIQSETGKMKAAAMMGAKNIRNLREFEAVTAPGDLLGGTQTNALAQTHGMYVAGMLQNQYKQFLKEYQGRHNTLMGADEVWQKYLDDNPSVIRDQKGDIRGINENALKPENWSKYVEKAPQIYKASRGQGVDSAKTQPSPEEKQILQKYPTAKKAKDGKYYFQENGQWHMVTP